MIALVDVTVFQPQREGGGKCRRARIAEVLQRREISFGTKIQAFKHQLPMGGPDLMTNRTVNVVLRPVERLFESVETGGPRFDPFGHQLFRICCHQRLHAGRRGFVGPAMA